MKFARKAALFTLGGSGYVGLELLYRGYSHVTMFGAGGLCFLLIGRLRKLPFPAPARMACGAGIITTVELVTGLLANRQYQIWDYRDQWGNLFGQICPAFTAVWFCLTAVALWLYGKAEAAIDKLF